MQYPADYLAWAEENGEKVGELSFGRWFNTVLRVAGDDPGGDAA